MSEAAKPEPTLKVVSLQPNVIYLKKSEQDVEEEVILAPFMLDEEKVIEDISELVDKVYDEFSKACEKRNLNWEAELELGMEFGVKFTAKLKIFPKS
jgi:excinuclease UvrABC helicase subunit UvrB